MRKGGGKAKGNGYEGKIAKLLTEYLTPLKFRRSQQSGAIVGGKNEKNLDQFSNEMKVLFISDVVPTNEAETPYTFRCCIETKFYKTPEHLDHLLGENNCIILKWFEESVVDAKKVNRLPVLIFKFNHTADYACVDGDVQLPPTVRHVVVIRSPAGLGFKARQVVLLKELLETPSWWFVNRITGQTELYDRKTNESKVDQGPSQDS